MAIRPIQKIDIITHKTYREELVRYLQDKGVVQIVDIKEPKTPLGPEEERDVEEKLAQLSYILKFLSRFEGKEGLLDGFIKPKFLLATREVAKIIKEFDYQKSWRECKRFQKRLSRLKHTYRRLHRWKEEVLPWLNLDMLLSDVRSTDRTEVVLGSLPSSAIENFSKDLEQATKKRVFLKVISKAKNKTYLLLIYLQEDNRKVSQTLQGYNFERVLYPRLGISPSKLNSFIDKRLTKLQAEEEDLTLQGRNLVEKIKVQVVVLCDYFTNLKAQRDIQKSFGQTQGTFRISGWIRKEDVAGLKDSLEKRFKEIAVVVKNPSGKERVPVALENKGIIRPFEMVTRLYGYPQYRALDPTPFLAPFFAFSFGLCLTDAGYGLLIVLFSLLLVRKFSSKIQVRNFFYLFILGGLATIFWGAITGGWFGDIIDRLPESQRALKNFKDSFILFKPEEKTLLFLSLVLALGYIQVWFGVAIKAVRDCRIGNYKSALLQDFPTLGIQSGLLLFLLVAAGVLSKEFFLYPVTGLLLFSGALIVYNQWRVNQEFALKIFWSIFSVYTIVAGNFLADTLSYVRLFALGLATGLLAKAVNEITFLIPSILQSLRVPVFIAGFVAVVIFCIGHIVNIAINILGAYVHTSRLQYLEFFTKFFEGGGRPFAPFKKENEYTLVK
jgi:V/A-type H+-transporting ATPase subunit I